MRKDTKNFYKKTKLKEKLEIDSNEEAPIEYVKVFHKTYPRLPSRKLKPRNYLDKFEELTSQRESIRSFSKDPMSYQQLSNILHSCRINDYNRDPERRSYPSAGARFPIETYVTNFNVEGIEKGAYHYNILDNTLETLLEENLDKEKESIISALENPAAAIVLTSAIPRSEVKYGAKAYPFSLIEAGHMGQNIILSSERENIGTCPIGGYVNDKVSEILDLTENEIPLYVIGLGKKQ
ncbi:MAG: SagB/ThcOx family dehydrogenase [Candidatus Pacearchaeota archaeon]